MDEVQDNIFKQYKINICTFEYILNSNILSDLWSPLNFGASVSPAEKWTLMLRCETLCLILREEHGLRVFENRALRRILGLKRDEVTGGWRKLHNKELHELFSSLSIIRMTNWRMRRWAEHVG
jgi:PAS domain-containing protein